MKCRRPSCSESAAVHRRGFCESDYRREVRKGIFGYRDAGPARAHVKKLRGLGWTYEQIADTARVSTWVPHKLATGGVEHVWPESERAILAVPLVPQPSHRGVDGTGTYRRLEALQWMGWPLAAIAERLELKPFTLCTLRSRGEPVSFRVAMAMAAAYGELSAKPGPSKQSATRARRRGYAGPAAWDGHDIDDPQARPLADLDDLAEVSQ